MTTPYRILIPALGLALGLWAGAAPAQAHENSGTMGAHSQTQRQGQAHQGEAAGHSHERCELHGGSVAMTKAHHFETLFAPDGVRVYMYSEDQNPLPMDKVSGTVTVKEMAGAEHEVPLVANVPKEGEPVVYYCTMHDSAPQMTPGKCPNCGMKLVPQGGLFGAADLSKAKPGSIKAVVHLTGLDGEEKEVTFTETNIAEEHASPEKPAPSSSSKSSEQMKGHTHSH
jgi:hypothetical protein